MDGLAHLRFSLGRALAWPIAVLAIAFGFRREIGVILSNLSKFRYKDFELQFGRKIEILKAEAEQEKVFLSRPSPSASLGTGFSSRRRN